MADCTISGSLEGPPPPLGTHPVHSLGKTSERVLALPIEIIEHISEFLFALVPPQSYADQSVISVKPTWVSVSGFMNASLALHKMGFVRWIQILTVRKHEDWEEILQRSPSVLELRCLEDAFTSKTPKNVLVQFKCLRALYIDAHGDIIRRESGQFAYRDLFKVLPPSLLRLEIAHAHGPDLRVIQTVREHCPNLVVLRLGRCSMFNRIPPCPFWREYPLDHDAYIAAIGTDDFAHSVAQELVPMHSLKALRIGVYFMHSNAVLAHRAYHVRGVPAPDGVDWQQALSVVQNIPVPQPPARLDQNLLVDFYHRDAEPDFAPDSCTFCHESFGPSRGAEARANRIIKRLLPGLQIMEWMDWFSPSHRGVSQHPIEDLVVSASNDPP